MYCVDFCFEAHAVFVESKFCFCFVVAMSVNLRASPGLSDNCIAGQVRRLPRVFRLPPPDFWSRCFIGLDALTFPYEGSRCEL